MLGSAVCRDRCAMNLTGRIYYLILLSIFPLAFSNETEKPEIINVDVVGKKFDLLSLRVIGRNFIPNPEFRTSGSDGGCIGPDYVLRGTERFPSASIAFIQIAEPREREIYLCVRLTGAEWVPQRAKLFIPKDAG